MTKGKKDQYLTVELRIVAGEIEAQLADGETDGDGRGL